MSASQSSGSMPWQPVAAGAGLFGLAGINAVSALTFSLQLSDWKTIKDTLPDWQSLGPALAAATAEEVYEWLLTNAYVFASLTVACLVLGVLMWRGITRHGARLTATILVVVNWVGALRLATTADGGGTGTGPGSNAVILLAGTVALVGVLTLWLGAGARWVRGD